MFIFPSLCTNVSECLWTGRDKKYGCPWVPEGSHREPAAAASAGRAGGGRGGSWLNASAVSILPELLCFFALVNKYLKANKSHPDPSSLSSHPRNMNHRMRNKQVCLSWRLPSFAAVSTITKRRRRQTERTRSEKQRRWGECVRFLSPPPTLAAHLKLPYCTWHNALI